MFFSFIFWNLIKLNIILSKTYKKFKLGFSLLSVYLLYSLHYINLFNFFEIFIIFKDNHSILLNQVVS